MKKYNSLISPMKNIILSLFLMITLVDIGTLSRADEGGAAAEMARKLQNPLANIRAVMTDNSIGLSTGDDEGTSYGFQLQPVYAIDMPERGFTLIPRAVIPVMGLEPGTKTRFTGEEGEPAGFGTDSVWGLGDSIFQLFFAPHSETGWKWGVGPQFSVATHTDEALKGPDWGAGIAGVVTGDITKQISFAGILGNHWSFDGSFNSALIQPMMFYNLVSIPGAYVGYNAVINVDWKADGSNRWTVPLGLSIGRTLNVGNGHGLDLMIGPYYNVARPDGAADWVLRFGISWLFP